jgi:hypothetical protein
MKNLDEKKFLLQMSRAFGQNLYPELEQSIKMEEELASVMLKETVEPSMPEPEQQTLIETPIVEETLPIVEISYDLTVSEEPEVITETVAEPMDLVKYTADMLTASASMYKDKTQDELMRVPLSPQLSPLSDVDSLKKSLSELSHKVATLSWGGGGSGEVNFKKLDDIDKGSIGNTDQILRYNPDTGFFFFGQLSGDQGPVRSLTYSTSGANTAPVTGTTTWNQTEDCLDIYQGDGTVLQTGLEHYIRVTNLTGNTIEAGTFVAFSGVNGNTTPTCAPYMANATAIPLYTIGVVTEPIANNQSARATVFGKVRDINTTGSSVGETWQIGDILWAHPTLAGKLTRVEPTAPYPATSVAAVLKVGVSDGIILVRPSIFPRLWYGSFSDSTNQTAALANTAYPVRFNTTQISAGHRIDQANTSRVVAQYSGLYNYEFSIQFTSSNSSKSKIWIWSRKNGVDVPNSANRVSVDGNGTDFAPSWNFQMSMQPNDYFELMWATDATAVSMTAASATAFCPAIPSAILTVSQINL